MSTTPSVLQPPSRAQTEVQETLVTVSLNLEELQKVEGPTRRHSSALEHFETHISKNQQKIRWWRRHRLKFFILGVFLLLIAIILVSVLASPSH
ncbi:hypothetical protein K7432_001893 [Basidiobolus ranarum]|uniref:Uncharacterized protein n=1 Tax=Basidiobolus ranarum TaxID=34480 RepID=A0ABR2W8Q9_9FUNG